MRLLSDDFLNKTFLGIPIFLWTVFGPIGALILALVGFAIFQPQTLVYESAVRILTTEGSTTEGCYADGDSFTVRVATNIKEVSSVGLAVKSHQQSEHVFVDVFNLPDNPEQVYLQFGDGTDATPAADALLTISDPTVEMTLVHEGNGMVLIDLWVPLITYTGRNSAGAYCFATEAVHDE